jgi:hypothetical protein
MVYILIVLQFKILIINILGLLIGSILLNVSMTMDVHVYIFLLGPVSSDMLITIM